MRPETLDAHRARLAVVAGRDVGFRDHRRQRLAVPHGLEHVQVDRTRIALGIHARRAVLHAGGGCAAHREQVARAVRRAHPQRRARLVDVVAVDGLPAPAIGAPLAVGGADEAVQQAVGGRSVGRMRGFGRQCGAQAAAGNRQQSADAAESRGHLKSGPVGVSLFFLLAQPSAAPSRNRDSLSGWRAGSTGAIRSRSGRRTRMRRPIARRSGAGARKSGAVGTRAATPRHRAIRRAIERAARWLKETPGSSGRALRHPLPDGAS